MLNITKDMVKKRYAAMRDDELLRLDERKLTPEARELYREETARRGLKEPEAGVRERGEEKLRSARRGRKVSPWRRRSARISGRCNRLRRNMPRRGRTSSLTFRAAAKRRGKRKTAAG